MGLVNDLTAFIGGGYPHKLIDAGNQKDCWQRYVFNGYILDVVISSNKVSVKK